MPEIAAGRFVRYAGRRELSAVVCPPYDVIDEAGRVELEEKDPHNFVRLILPRAPAGEAEEERYRRARGALTAWIDEGVLAVDPQPSILAVEQTFAEGGAAHVRRGLFALVKLTEFSEGRILPHERTLAGPKADRLRLLEAVGAQLSPIFVLYPDAANEVTGSLADVFARPPDEEAELDGVTNRAWRVTDPARVRALRAALADRTGYIADGHHRYETALNHRRRAASTGRVVTGTALDYIPALLCGMSDPGLLILPTHRLVHSLALDSRKLLRDLDRFFEARPIELTDAETMRALLADAGSARPSFGLVTPETLRILTLRADAPLASVPSLPAAPSLRALDVTLLHAVVFEHLLGMSRESQERQEHLRYSKSLGDAVQQVRTGKAVAAFLLNPTRMDQMREVAQAGEVMPQKSTWFYPKIVDGLALQRFDEPI